MASYVALFRGINVGKAKAIAMPELARVFESAGYSDVKTVLRSGNVVFTSSRTLAEGAAKTLESAVVTATGVTSSILLLDASEFEAIAEADPLLDIATDGSKSFVTFVHAMPKALEIPDAAALAPEVLAVGESAVYQWMPLGSLQTRVPKSFWKQFDAPVTARNWNTVQKLRALLVD
jgi:uncharacterized protein (DUF1697 family)